jgi:SAM-dependent methyltransferase
MPENSPTLEGLEQVLETIAGDPRIPPNFTDWIRGSLRTSGWKIQALRYFQQQYHSKTTSSVTSAAGVPASMPPASSPCLLDVGAQFGALSIYAAKLGCRVSAVDYGPNAKIYRAIAADHGVDYRECDVGAEPLPFPDKTFDFVTYTDVIEHHSFSPKRVFEEIRRVLAPGGRLILLTPNHASIYNRVKLLLGRSVNDDFDYFFNTCAEDKVYDGHHREYTRGEIRSAIEQTQFRVIECRVVEQDLAALRYALRRDQGGSQNPAASRDPLLRQLALREFVLCALGKILMPLHLPFGRWIWAVGEKPRED